MKFHNSSHELGMIHKFNNTQGNKILYNKFILLLISRLLQTNIYDTNNVERLTQMDTSNILVYSSFISSVASFQLIKSPKYIKFFQIMYSMSIYYNHCMIEPLQIEL
jgi:hypothetical protein